MSKFKCTCGEVIYDQTDHLPYKGYLFADPARQGFPATWSHDP